MFERERESETSALLARPSSRGATPAESFEDLRLFAFDQSKTVVFDDDPRV
jgi:hypothetical protein